MSGGVRRRLPALLAALAFAAALAALAPTALFRALESQLSTREIAAPLGARNRLRDRLQRDRALHVQPPGDLDRRAPVGADGRCPDPQVGTDPVLPARMPSSLRAPLRAVPSTGTLVSLWVEPCRLQWLHQKRRFRGRPFEELGWLSLFERGELRFASAVGVRLHGVTSRLRPPFSYRVYFRGTYGEKEFPAALLSPELSGALERLVLKHDAGLDIDRQPWLWADPVALEIGRRLGAHAPHARPVRVSLSGAPPIDYYLIEPIAGDFLARRFGHAEFDRVAGKTAEHDPQARLLRAEAHWLDAQPSPLLARDVAERFDLAGLTNSLVTALFVGAGDSFQDALVRDRRGRVAAGRWTPILWDLDFAFRERPRSAPRFAGHDDLLPMLLDAERPPSRTLARLLGRLLREDPAFRGRVAARLQEALDRELAPAELAELVARYRRLADDLGVVDRRSLDALDDYFARRPGELADQASRHLGVRIAPRSLAAPLVAGAAPLP